jgi:hypothetical protein
MTKKPAKQPSLVSQLKAAAPTVSVCPLLFLTGDDKKELDEVIAAIKAGQLKHLSINEIRSRVCARFNVKVPKTTFREFLVKNGIKQIPRITGKQ